MNDEASLREPVRDTERLVAEDWGESGTLLEMLRSAMYAKKQSARGGGEIPKEVAFQESREGFSSNRGLDQYRLRLGDTQGEVAPRTGSSRYSSGAAQPSRLAQLSHGT